MSQRSDPCAGWPRRVAGRALGAVTVPSFGLGRARRRSRLLAVVAVRDEIAYLPGFFANLAPHVDGIVALDDGSTDGSGEQLAASASVLEVLRGQGGRAGWDEVGNYRRLHAAALRLGAGWILSIDADERVECRFRDRAERVIAHGGRLGVNAFAVKLRELWGCRGRYRCDGIWGRKSGARLFAALGDHCFDERPLHATKAPLQAKVLGRFVAADLEIYHLRMIRHEDREARRDRYKRLDPEERWQPGVGYDYLADETGLRLRKVPRRRGFLDGGAGDVG
jgi:hypothetical protein